MTYPRITVASTRAAIEVTGYTLVRRSFLDHEHRNACALGLRQLVVGETAFRELPLDYREGVAAGFENWHREVMADDDYQAGYRDGVMIREALKPPFYEEWLSAKAEAEEPRPASGGEHEPDQPCACGHRTWEEFPSSLQTEVAC